MPTSTKSYQKSIFVSLHKKQEISVSNLFLYKKQEQKPAPEITLQLICASAVISAAVLGVTLQIRHFLVTYLLKLCHHAFK